MPDRDLSLTLEKLLVPDRQQHSRLARRNAVISSKVKLNITLTLNLNPNS